MTESRLRAALADAARAPFFVGALAIAVFVIWAAKDAGFTDTTWYPGALFLLALLVVVLAAYAPARQGVPRPTLLAIALLAGFAAWSAASIGWSDAQGIAWDGANRTFLYVIVYALFAVVPWRRASPVVFLVSFALAIATIGMVDLIRAAYGNDPAQFFIHGRFAAPAGYQNAACALFVLAAWPAVYLAARREVAPPVRGALIAIAVVLADLAVMTESRASLVAVPIAVAVYLALVPARTRALLPLLAVTATIAAALGPLLAPYKPLTHGLDPTSELHGAVIAIFVSALVVGVAWTVFGFVDLKVHLSEHIARAVAGAVLLACAVAAVIAAVVFLSGSPGRRIERAWHEFKSGYPVATSSSTHFSSGLGNNRYDFWRVALDEFRNHPLEGVGVDNFAEDYLAARRSPEEPLYPHSLELRVLSQTGAVGAVLFAGFLIAAGIAAAGPFHSGGVAAGAVRAGLAATAYWAIHGSIDWFWEFPGLTAPAFAWLGLAASWGRGNTGVTARRSRALRLVTIITGTLGAAALAVSFLLPWWSVTLQNRAADTWRSSPTSAFRDLDRARRLSPLSPDPDLLEGAIASRLDQLPRMRRAFSRALRRDDRLWYAYFELALAEASMGHRSAALGRLEQARRLDPREPAIALVRPLIRSGRPVDRAAIDSLFIRRVRGLVGG
ncbi:MAG: O-antigen ligase family protein [Gaiellaceae bacterium]